MTKLNKTQIKKLAPGKPATEILHFSVDADTTIDIEVKKTIPIEDRIAFVQLVMGSVFQDVVDENDTVTSAASFYAPINQAFATRFAILRYFAGFPYTAETVMLADNYELVKAVCDLVDDDALCEVYGAIEASIEYRKQELTSLATRLSDIVTNLGRTLTSEQFQEVVSGVVKAAQEYEQVVASASDGLKIVK